jgi:uncharacterized protein YciI
MNRYLVLTRRGAAFDPAVIGPHYAFLDELRRSGRLELAGPFADRSGGAYVLQADNLAAAEAIAWSDPLHLTHASQVIVHEWAAK